MEQQGQEKAVLNLYRVCTQKTIYLVEGHTKEEAEAKVDEPIRYSFFESRVSG